MASKDFYALGDTDLEKLASAAPLRAPARGTADIGGRMRVVSILRSIGINDVPAPERIAGSTNEVWRAGPYIVRVGFVPGADRLRREALIAAVLPQAVQYPKVIASGHESFGEWLVLRYLPANTLSSEWKSLDDVQRRDAIVDVAHAVQAVHEVELDDEQRAALVFNEDDGALALPQQLDLTRLRAMVNEAAALPFVDPGLIDAIDARLRAVGDVFDGEAFRLIHGDLHLENVLSRDGVFVSLVDFEWARLSRREIDIEVLARFCAHPEMHVGGGLTASDYRDTLRWFNEAYPALFEAPRLADRFMLCSLSYELPSLLRWPPDAPAQALSAHHPVNRLRELLDHGSYAERVGWDVGGGGAAFGFRY